MSQITAKQKSIWVCSACQNETLKWAGQCHACQAWNTLIEQLATPKSASRHSSQKVSLQRVWRLHEVGEQLPERLSTGMQEVDRLLGGGIVSGSLILLAGDPGIGKSTLLLQLSANICSKPSRKVLYVSGEESIPQISLRASRLKIQAPGLLLVSETRCAAIRQHIEQEKPDLVVIDSIQITYKDEIPSAPGSVLQVRECSSEFLHIAKAMNIPIVLIGHVTKSGDLAGPRVLEHMVDTVLHFESDVEAGLRLIRGIKNRFGATDELAVLQMSEKGLEEVKNPSAFFLRQAQRDAAGGVVVACIEGSRSMLVEVQALVAKSFYPQPTRKCSGFDPNRLAVLLAVLEKKVGLPLHTCDVFISVAGGLKIHEPAMDLAIVAAITSSLTGRPIDPRLGVMAEIGLAGELRPVSRSSMRLKELANMGFRKCISAQGSEVPDSKAIQVQLVSSVKEALHAIGCLP